MLNTEGSHVATRSLFEDSFTREIEYRTVSIYYKLAYPWKEILGMYVIRFE